MTAPPAGGTRLSAAELARRTPATRDRYVDFLRAASIVVVAVGHWSMMVNDWSHGFIRSTNPLGDTHGLWLATWAFEVMPLFFFAGGFSNYTAYESHRRRGGSTTAFLERRLRRLLLPAAAFVGVWTAVQVGLHVLDVGGSSGPRLWDGTYLLRGVRPPGQLLPFGPLWFLAVYVGVVLLAPAAIALHHRFGVRVPVALAGAVVAVDAAHFAAGVPWVGMLNIGFVYLLPHQLGFFYADGRLLHARRRVHVAFVAGGLATMVVLTNAPLFRLLGDVGPRWFHGLPSYPRSLLGTGTEPVTNLYPPTLVLAAGGIWMVGAAMLARPAVDRWLRRARPWAATVALNLRVMTVYLWHTTAYLLAVLLLWPLGIGHETTPSARWWLERPVWVAVSALLLTVLVAVFGPVERSGHGAPEGA